MARSVIELHSVSVEAHGRKLFKVLDWKIKAGENWAVIGPNGSGRSSLMRVLEGSFPIASGSIRRRAKDIRYVSFDTQRSHLPYETFIQDRWNVGLRENDLSVADLLPKVPKHVVKDFGLKKLLARQIIDLSNGERRKVEIARALLKLPSLLILDNPYEGLDEHFRKKLSKILNGVMKKTQLIIVATDRDELPSGITHVLRIKDGTITKGTRKEQEGKLGALPALSRRRLDNTREELERTKAGTLPTEVKKTKKGGEILVQMNKVSVSYDGRHILKNVSWIVRERERWALFGPNGAGKTTLLSLILADNPQGYANDITLFGNKRGTGESIWEIKKNIGSVSPELQLYYPSISSGQAPAMSCLDVACSGWFDTIGLYRKPNEDQKEVALAWLQKFSVAEIAGELFEDVSEGEQRLTLIARAMVKNPRLLILDEPCQGLDTKHRDRVVEAVDSIEEDATTIIYVTHRADELPKTITNILRLK